MEKTPKQRKSKKDKDENKPKRPQSAYMLWLNDTRDQIKADNPGISVVDITKKAGELWKKVGDRSKWEAKAKEAKDAYDRAMKEYNAGGGAASKTEKPSKSAPSKSSGSTKPSSKSSKPSPTKSPGDFKSKEFISSEESSGSDSDGRAKKKSSKAGTSKKAAKKSKEESEDEDEEMASSSASSEMSDSD